MHLPTREEGPPTAHRHVVQTLYAPRAGVVVVCFLGAYRGLLTHWKNGEPIPCIGEADCPDAMHKIRPTWKGYAPVRWYNPAGDWWIPAVLEMSECFEELVRGRQLRGEVWEVFRSAGRRKTRPIQGRFLEARPLVGLWDTFDMVPVLQRRYHTATLLLDVPNPVVPRLVLTVEKAPPPAACQVPPSAPIGETKEDAYKRQLAAAEVRRLARTNGHAGG